MTTLNNLPSIFVPLVGLVFPAIAMALPIIGIGIYPDFVFSLSVDKVEAILSNYFYG